MKTITNSYRVNGSNCNGVNLSYGVDRCEECGGECEERSGECKECGEKCGGEHRYTCMHCFQYFLTPHKYCPNCGYKLLAFSNGAERKEKE